MHVSKKQWSVIFQILLYLNCSGKKQRAFSFDCLIHIAGTFSQFMYASFYGENDHACCTVFKVLQCNNWRWICEKNHQHNLMLSVSPNKNLVDLTWWWVRVKWSHWSHANEFRFDNIRGYRKYITDGANRPKAYQQYWSERWWKYII